MHGFVSVARNLASFPWWRLVATKDAAEQQQARHEEHGQPDEQQSRGILRHVAVELATDEHSRRPAALQAAEHAAL